MRRMCVLVVYDQEGIIDDYIFYLLDSLRAENIDVNVVVNGWLEQEYRGKLDEHAASVAVRENAGYDSWAYKYFLDKFGAEIRVANYDEIILMNDTFYGPLYPWKQLFDRMKREAVDFWGLSRSEAGYARGLKKNIPEHLQSYFLAIRKNMLASESFWQFWRELKRPLTYSEAIRNFEFKFTRYFREHGFRYTSYLDVMGYRALGGVNPYIVSALEIIKDYGFPIVKGKALAANNFIEGKKAFDYIKSKLPYNEKLIWEHFKRQDKNGQTGVFSYYQINRFAASYDNVYIYGNGKVGRNLGAYFAYKGWQVKAYIVSSKGKNDSSEVIEFKDLKLARNDGVIIGVINQDDGKEIYNKLLSIANENQILQPY